MGPPDDDLEQIIRAYEVFGVDPLDGLDEFALFGGKLDPEFLSEKAKKQFRDKWGKFREMRGKLFGGDKDRKDRGIHLDNLGPKRLGGQGGEPAPWGAKGRWGRNVPRKLPPSPEPVRVLHGSEAEKALLDAGARPELADLRALESHVFTRDGKHFVTMPSAKATALRDVLPLMQEQNMARDGVKAFISMQQEYLARGELPPDDLVQHTERLAKRFEAATDAVNFSMQRYSAIPEDHPPEPDQVQMATAALDELEAATKRLPAWRRDKDGRGNPASLFTVNMDEANFPPGSDMAGYSYVGRYDMEVNPTLFDKRPEEVFTEGHLMPTGYETVGRYTINHEMGHMTDTPGAWGSVTRPDIWERAKATGEMSQYGRSDVYEGYAEAFAMWMSGQKYHPVVKIYAEAFGWDKPIRSDVPAASALPSYVQPWSDAEDQWYTSMVDFLKTSSYPLAETARKGMETTFKSGDLERLRTWASAMKGIIPGAPDYPGSP